MHKIFFIFLILSFQAQAQENLDVIEVQGSKEESFSGFWEENKGTQIYSGKKNTVTSLKEIPKLQTNNYRQATSQTPGLLISEVPNESLAAITFRGLGDPHESYNVLLLQDGLPISADMYGYPAHYFSPALPMMDKVQFIRGGAGLLFGPQPGGVLNYMSTPLKKDQALSGRVGLTGGSYSLLTTNNALYGSSGDHAWGVEYHRRQGKGPQKTNSDFEADYVQIRDHIFKGKNTYKISFNGYNSDHGEPGGYGKTRDANINTFGESQSVASKKFDRLRVSRAQLALGLDRKIDDASELQVTFWGTAYNRYSKRQTGSGFGAIFTANTNSIVEQKYYGYNGEVRYLRNYTAFGNEHTFSGGYLNYNLLSPMTTEVGTRADANHGDLTKRNQRESHVNSFFAENRFSFGKLMVTPGVRVENIRQTIDERKNQDRINKAQPLRYNDETENVPLFGLGIAYHLTDESQLYANTSEAYKPVSWGEAVPAGNNDIVSETIEPSKILSHEIGYRGQTSRLNWDLSAFFIRFENKFGQVGTRFENVGNSTHKGVDAAAELKTWGNFNLYGNIEVLDARFTRGPKKGNTPQYAPKTISRAGVIYNNENKIKAALMGVVVGRHYGNDDNGNGAAGNDFEIPSYTVFDLTADWEFKKNWELSGGVNNLLDRQYFSRVRTDGIAWAMGRNYYAGLNYKF